MILVHKLFNLIQVNLLYTSIIKTYKFVFLEYYCSEMFTLVIILYVTFILVLIQSKIIIILKAVFSHRVTYSDEELLWERMNLWGKWLFAVFALKIS